MYQIETALLTFEIFLCSELGFLPQNKTVQRGGVVSSKILRFREEKEGDNKIYTTDNPT